MTSGSDRALDVTETLAGLAFLERHAPLEFLEHIQRARLCCEDVRKKARLARIRQISIDDLELSVRSHNALSRLGLLTLGGAEQFLDQADFDVLIQGKPHHFGKKCMREVRDLIVQVLHSDGRVGVVPGTVI